MDNCREVFALLSQYLDRELPPDVCRDIENHLAACPPCIEFVDSLRATVHLSRNYRPEDLPRPMADGVRTQLLNAYRKCREAALPSDEPSPLK